MVSEEQKKEYQDYVKEITPTHNTPRNIFRAFWTGGTVCVIGQILSVFFEKMVWEKRQQVRGPRLLLF